MLALLSRRFIRLSERRIVVHPTLGDTRPYRILCPRKPNLIALAFCLLFQSAAGSGLKEVRRVAVLYQHDLSSPSVALFDREMPATLEESNVQIEVNPEFMETPVFDDSGDQEQFREAYIPTHQNPRPDPIVAPGPSPLQFMVNSYGKFLAGILIVFGGTSVQQAHSPTLDSHFTGCWTMCDPAKTLDAAVRLKPDSAYMVAASGVSSFDQHLDAIFRERLPGYEAELGFTSLTGLPMPGLLARLQHLSDHAIVLYTQMLVGSKGTRYAGASQAGPMLANASNTPVFGLSDVDLGRGEVGGYLHNFAMEGKIAGEIAGSILHGERTRDTPMVHRANAYMFDEPASRHWRFRQRAHSLASALLHRPPALWWRSRSVWILLPVIGLCLSAFVLIAGLKWAQDRQFALSGISINAQETERDWIEPGINDNSSQRLLKRLIAKLSSERGRLLSLQLICALIPIILVFDLMFEHSVGILYIIPVVLASLSTRTRWIVPLAFLFAILSWWGATSVSFVDGTLYFIFSFVSYVSVGYLLNALVRRHRMAVDNLNTVKEERASRQEAEALAKRRHSELSGMLINAQEKERSRLASEIHDDFSQRLALMALELETAEETIATAPQKAVEQVHNVLNFASELGADLHTLSHRLHSSTLDRLGLVPGVTALCTEFAAQQGIQVDLLTKDVPHSVNHDVALCLFRIIQEGLRNLKKHSGALKGQVRLRRIGDRLLVTVCDEGTGFDLRDLQRKEGLGIRSMGERADLLGGEFEIYSQPGKGTTIEAWVPLQPESDQRTGTL